jgi:glucokinase
MILAGDVGGTKVDLALYDFSNGKLEYTRDKVYRAKEYPASKSSSKSFSARTR